MAVDSPRFAAAKAGSSSDQSKLKKGSVPALRFLQHSNPLQTQQKLHSDGMLHSLLEEDDGKCEEGSSTDAMCISG